MAEWKGTAKGTLLGYRIFVFSIRNIGLWFSYTLLLFVAFYYFLTSWKSSKYIYRYFRERLHFSFVKAFFGIYRSYFVFGQTLIDRIMIASGKRHRFTYEFDGIENIIKKQEEGNGAILISAHLGNFEVSEYFFDDLDETFVANIVTTKSGKEGITNYLKHLSIKSRMKFILVQEDMMHVLELKKALEKNEFICITGDRFMKGTKFSEAELLGATAQFPAGPFILATRLKVPVLFVYVMKDSLTHYHLYAREIEVTQRKNIDLLERYTESLSEMMKKYPYQWFNYFDFWSKGVDFVDKKRD